MQIEFTAYTLANLANLAKQREPADPPLPSTPDAQTAVAPVPEVLSSAAAEDRLEHYTERAAIQEHDGGVPRRQAEVEARQAVFQGRHAYHFTLSDYPTEAPVVITGAATAEIARTELEQRFGQGRVIACWRVGEDDDMGEREGGR